MFYEKSILKSFAKFTGKHLRRSLFFNKVTGFRSATLLKKRLRHKFFTVHFVKFLRTPFLTAFEIGFLWLVFIVLKNLLIFTLELILLCLRTKFTVATVYSVTLTVYSVTLLPSLTMLLPKTKPNAITTRAIATPNYNS